MVNLSSLRQDNCCEFVAIAPAALLHCEIACKTRGLAMKTREISQCPTSRTTIEKNTNLNINRLPTACDIR